MDKHTHLEVQLAADHEQKFYAGMQGDMSYGGVFVEMSQPPDPGVQVEVAITLPDGARIRAHGAVRWVRPSELTSADCPEGCGVAWQAIDKRSVVAVRRYLAAKNRRKPLRTAALKAA